MFMRFVLLAGLLALPAIAQADDRAAASACSAKLSTDGRTIYDKVAPTVTARTDLKEAIAEVARPMVMHGTLTRDAARHAGEAAGECLYHLK